MRGHAAKIVIECKHRQHHDEGQCCCQKAHGVAEGQGEHIICIYILVVDQADEAAGTAAAGGEGILHYQDEWDGVEKETTEEEGGSLVASP